MTVKVTGKVKPMDIDDKRFCIDGVYLESECPECGKTETKHLGADYLTYPSIGSAISIEFWHEAPDEWCDHFWEDEIVLTLTVESA